MAERFDDYPNSDWNWQYPKCGKDLEEWFDKNEPCSRYSHAEFNCPHCNTIMEIQYDETYSKEDGQIGYFNLKLISLGEQDISFLDALAGCKKVVDVENGKEIKCGDFVTDKPDSDKIFCNECHKAVSKGFALCEGEVKWVE